MKIQKLEVQNIKGIQNIEVHADPDLNEISGDNGEGKSSLLDSILYAIGGGKNIDDHALRNGQKKGEITIDVGDFVIKRTFTEKGSYLKVQNVDGKMMNQGDLDGFFDIIAFDPLRFANSKTNEQKEMLFSLMSAADKQKVGHYTKSVEELAQDRTLKGREKKNFSEVELPEDVERVDVGDLLKQIDEIANGNKKSDQYNIKVNENLQNVDEINTKIEDMKNEINALEKEKQQSVEWLKDNGKVPLDLQGDKYQKEKLANAEEINRKADEYDRILKSNKQGEVLAIEYDKLTERIKKGKLAIQDIYKNGSLPFKEVLIEDDQVTFRGKDIKNLSSAEKIKLSTGIAVAMNPDLKIIIIKDGALLDKKSFNVLKKFVADKGFQLWIETVGEGNSDNAIIIKEGLING